MLIRRESRHTAEPQSPFALALGKTGFLGTALERLLLVQGTPEHQSERVPAVRGVSLARLGRRKSLQLRVMVLWAWHSC